MSVFVVQVLHACPTLVSQKETVRYDGCFGFAVESLRFMVLFLVVKNLES